MNAKSIASLAGLALGAQLLLDELVHDLQAVGDAGDVAHADA